MNNSEYFSLLSQMQGEAFVCIRFRLFKIYFPKFGIRLVAIDLEQHIVGKFNYLCQHFYPFGRFGKLFLSEELCVFFAKPAVFGAELIHPSCCFKSEFGIGYRCPHHPFTVVHYRPTFFGGFLRPVKLSRFIVGVHIF